MAWVIAAIVIAACLTAPWWATDSRVGRDWQWHDSPTVSLHPWMSQQLAEERARDRLEEAAQHRLARAARGPRRSLRDWLRAVVGRVRRGIAAVWRASEEAQRRLVTRNRPWETDGELRWQHRVGGWELHGEAAPEPPAPSDGPATETCTDACRAQVSQPDAC